MEINVTDKQKIILEGFIRSGVFLVVMRELYSFVYTYIVVPLHAILFNSINAVFGNLYIHLTKNIVFNEYDEAMCVFLTILFSFLFTIMLDTYIIAKFCGLFKYFSQFKFWKSFLMLLIISVILNYFYMLNLHTFQLNHNFKDTEAVYTIVPTYLVYLFLNFLTKKFPKPFKQIGYFFSIEFYKDLYKKLFNKLKPSD